MNGRLGRWRVRRRRLSGRWCVAQPQRLPDGLDGVIGQMGDVGKGSVPDLSIGAKGFADGDGAVGFAVTMEAIGLDVHTGHYITHSLWIHKSHRLTSCSLVQATS
jgi:hypothetical protein